jgi:alpha-glucan,water dikinase
MNTEGQDGSMTTQTISTASGLKVIVERRCGPQQVELLLRVPAQKNCVLHWGVCDERDRPWRSLPESEWPKGTRSAGPNAMQTTFASQDGEGRIAISLGVNRVPELLQFALFFPDEKRWDNNGHRNYEVSLCTAESSSGNPGEYLLSHRPTGELIFEKTFILEQGRQLAADVVASDQEYRVRLTSNLPELLILHWGITNRSPQEWVLPPEALRPQGTVVCAGNTAQTPFEFRDGLNQLELHFPRAEAPSGLQFVLKQGTDGQWIKNQQRNFYIPIRTLRTVPPGSSSELLQQLEERIVQAESSGSWTLMHRFNLCHDLLGQAQDDLDGLALLFVWLRFSAIRQLTWQRNYNTKPRELAHAQDRLADRLADLYQQKPEGRPWLRLMLATIGKGGDGQRIRDEILQIMHRHHLKEVTGHFLEEWHQKLHNNTTPDDIVICQAYLEFLRSNGNLQRFYEVLETGGITRQRLESFERPIRTQPNFVGHLKEALIHDFQNFLKILNAVHSSTDLETAIQSAGNRFGSEAQALLWHVWNHRNDSGDGVVPLVERITEARRHVSQLLNSRENTRSLLYLDLALEQLMRVVIERNLHSKLQQDVLAQLINSVLENVTLSRDDAEFGACSRHWQRLCQTPAASRSSPEWALHARSVLDRIGRALADWTDRLYKTLQPKAEFLGHAFNAEAWTVTLFSEEVVRGSSFGFSLSMLLQQIDRHLRTSAQLGNWQIVSRGGGVGRIEVVEMLGAIQGKTFSEPVAVIADKVSGDEELPDQVVAVLAPDVTDLVSHVAVRARNSRTLFAACSDLDLFNRLKALKGRFVHFQLTPAGDVIYQEVSAVTAAKQTRTTHTKAILGARPKFTKYALTLDEFDDRTVGAKSLSQARLRGKMPDWAHQPVSVALPFGCFEQVMSLPENVLSAQRLKEVARSSHREVDAQQLAVLRNVVQSLQAPEQLKTGLRDAFTRVGLAWPLDWGSAWNCIKTVWASKWNERAVLSRHRMQLADDDLFMAVLIQPVVQADYAFVIHTVNPSTGDAGELYAEVVLGLGETLVGNFPGRAMGFTWNKRSQQIRVVSYPSKSIGLFGGGLIVRSDSNGEDLEGYAGAGLYDSVVLPEPSRKALDYSSEPLVWDNEFRGGLLTAIARLGMAVEKATGSPQDIEGAVSKGEYFIVQSRPQVGLDPAQNKG